jgi:ABC-type dipeptide/oligopeptide/nickel transport system permease subunit
MIIDWELLIGLISIALALFFGIFFGLVSSP